MSGNTTFQGCVAKSIDLISPARDFYEKQVEEKNKQSDAHVTATTYKASIEDSNLDIFLVAEWINASPIEAIAKLQL